MVLPVGERKGGSSTTRRWGGSTGVVTSLGGSIAQCGVAAPLLASTASSSSSSSSSSSVRSGVPAGDTLTLEEPLRVAYKSERTRGDLNSTADEKNPPTHGLETV